MKPCKTAAANRCWGIKYILREMIRALIIIYINATQRKREILRLLGNTLFQNSPVWGTKIIVNTLRSFNTSDLFLVMKPPIFVARFQKGKLHFYGNSRKNAGGREAPCKRARHTRAQLSLCAARSFPHDGTLSIKIRGFVAAPGGSPIR